MVLQSRINWVLQQAHIRLGDEYVYGGVYSPTNIRQGADCSGVVGWVLEALTKGPEDMNWDHDVNTESWNPGADPGDEGPYGTIKVEKLEDIPADAALTVNIMHGGGGPYSHMNCVVPLPGSLPYEGVIVESNGGPTTYPAGDGSCTNGTGGNPSDADLWNDHWYVPGPWIMDVPPAMPVDVAPPAPVNGKSYTVDSGDTLAGIADDLGVSLEALEQANPDVTDPNLIYPGQVLNVP